MRTALRQPSAVFSERLATNFMCRSSTRDLKIYTILTTVSTFTANVMFFNTFVRHDLQKSADHYFGRSVRVFFLFFFKEARSEKENEQGERVFQA